MTTILPTDENSHVIPVARLRPGGAHKIVATTASSARNATGFDGDTRILSVYATGAVALRFSADSSVAAATTDHYFPAGIYYDFAIGGGKVPHYNYLAVRAMEADCVVYLSEKE